MIEIQICGRRREFNKDGIWFYIYSHFMQVRRDSDYGKVEHDIYLGTSMEKFPPFNIATIGSIVFYYVRDQAYDQDENGKFSKFTTSSQRMFCLDLLTNEITHLPQFDQDEGTSRYHVCFASEVFVGPSYSFCTIGDKD